MEYRTLGQRLRGVGAVPRHDDVRRRDRRSGSAHEQLDVFVDAGGTFVDTADVYSAGASEEIVGRWLAARPRDVVDRIVLATKGRFAMGDDPNASAPRGGTCAEHWMTRSRGSASIMSTSTSCTWDPHTHIEETLRFLDDAVRAGKIGYPGLSNFTGWQVQKAVDVAERTTSWSR